MSPIQTLAIPIAGWSPGDIGRLTADGRDYYFVVRTLTVRGLGISRYLPAGLTEGRVTLCRTVEPHEAKVLLERWEANHG